MFSFNLPVNRIRRVSLIAHHLFVPSTEKHQGFDFTQNQQSVFATLNNFTEDKSQSELPAISTINISTEKSYNNIRELLQDDSMFHLDRDPSLFESSFGDDLNNNLGLEQIKEFEEICSQNYIQKCSSDFENFSELPEWLLEEEMTEKKENSPPASPAPVVVEAMVVKKEEPTAKAEFDLINFIFSEGVSEIDDAEIENVLNVYFPQNEDLLTPQDERPAPIFEVVEAPFSPVTIKPEPEPSTSKAPSPIPEERPRRRAPKRRYSSDSDFSIQTSASSYNTTAKRSKKRGRPAKELITNLPTIEDFNHLPQERASHLVLRIKNNEASRKSRMKSKSKQTAMEDECDRLEDRKQRLKIRKNKLEGQIETLRRWLLGIN
jgi:hypothetical protein